MNTSPDVLRTLQMIGCQRRIARSREQSVVASNAVGHEAAGLVPHSELR